MSDRLPCGCVMDTVGDAFVYQPCSPTCQFWLYVQEEMTRQGKPIRSMFDPELPEEERRKMAKDYGVQP